MVDTEHCQCRVYHLKVITCVTSVMISEGKLLEGQAVTLEDGTTAVVQGTITPKRNALPCLSEAVFPFVLAFV